jgi:hypothetical protein
MPRTEVALNDQVVTVSHGNRGYPVGGRAAALIRWIAANPTLVNDDELMRMEVHCKASSLTVHRALRTASIDY